MFAYSSPFIMCTRNGFSLSVSLFPSIYAVSAVHLSFRSWPMVDRYPLLLRMQNQKNLLFSYAHERVVEEKWSLVLFRQPNSKGKKEGLSNRNKGK